MSDKPDWRQEAERRLRARGHRAGGARTAVVEQLAQLDCCVSAQELLDELHGTNRRVGLASVYRALDLLHELELTQRVDLGDGEARFEKVTPQGDHHHHAICDACGSVTPFEDDKVEAAIDQLAVRLGHLPRSHDLVLRGRCPGCAEGAA